MGLARLRLYVGVGLFLFIQEFFAMTKLEVFNYALSFIGQNLLSKEDDGSVEAEVLGFFYRFAKSDVVEAYPWGFCRMRERLTSHAERCGRHGFSHAFAKPDGLVRLVSVNGEEWEAESPFARVEGDVIYANDDVLDLVYSADPGDIKFWDESVAKLVGVRLAELACIRLTCNAQLSDALGQRFTREAARVRGVETRGNVSGRANYTDRFKSRRRR